MQKNVIERLVSDLGGIDEDAEVFLCLLLTDVFRDRPGAQRALAAVLRQAYGSGDLFVDLVRKTDSHTILPLFDHTTQDRFDDLLGAHARGFCGL